MSYWRQKAAPWVSFSVLSGGLLAAIILFVVFQFENSLSSLEIQQSEEEFFSSLERRK